MRIDKVEKGIEKWEVWFPPEGSLVLCDAAGHPSVFDFDGRLFMFLWSSTRTDEEIYEDLRKFKVAGYPGPYNLFRADLSPAVAEGAGDDFTLLLDVPLANIHTVVGITGITVT